ncbi:thiol-disulfide interchange protein DsbD homolog [Cellvibrio japonicus Ueda107]|uniref:Thiol-disulfide interchange protein DsbD homolog n=2 Tax=Cellvibrio japonicus TaxID=155077 RepID=B3PDV6_CELJU|nr:thioredoxin family protein [Cellvibrio japonicus]ACE86090.1 thiol-disulfide interchange protein DsbD homolog [Cellvibrio japonicus Ueda107]
MRVKGFYRMGRLCVWLLGWLLISVAGLCRAEPVIDADHVRISWLAPSQMGLASSQKTLGILFEVDPHWHVYWRNPGDSGAAPRFDWRGNYASVSEPLWPFPARLPVAHLTNLGYEGDVAYLFQLVLPETPDEHLEVRVDLEWLVCQEECIPGFGSLSLQVPLVDGRDVWDSASESLLAHFKARVPLVVDDGQAQVPWQLAKAVVSNGNRTLALHLHSADANAPEPQVYPLDGAFVTAAAPQTVNKGMERILTFTLEPAAPVPEHLGFVAVSGDRAWEWSAVSLTVGGEIVNPVSEPLWWLLLLAFAGGVLLNLMPCVFPVLSIKLFSLMKTREAALALRVREGLLYSAGVLATFALLGLSFLLLRAAGAGIGWGFQLQSPWIVLGLAILFWLMALSFIGAFEFGHSLMALAGRSSASGSFMTGVLAVFVAAPCTGPFMGAALGASASLPPLSAMAIFIGLGAGLAAPFLLLAVSPRLSALLPKPGPWMERLRQLLAFPLFATVLWLLWVLDELLGQQTWLVASALLLSLAFALWLGQGAGRKMKAFAWILALIVLVIGFRQLPTEPSASVQPTASAWRGYDPDLVQQALDEGRPVFIDYTAAWCITCQVNKKLVLDTDEIQNLFAERQVLLIRADWTRYDQRITQALATLGRNSVPVYAYYPAGSRSPELLPQVLTPALVREHLR